MIFPERAAHATRQPKLIRSRDVSTEVRPAVGSSHPYTASAQEARERNLRHRFPEEVMPKGAVVNDSAAAELAGHQ
jgi:hypothetical protein